MYVPLLPLFSALCSSVMNHSISHSFIRSLSLMTYVERKNENQFTKYQHSHSVQNR